MSQKIKTSVEVDGYLSADHLKISTSSLEPVDVGEIVWNQIDGTFDMGLIGGVTLQSGQEMHMYGKATQSISNGDAVMFAGVQGDHILIAKADSATINVNPEYFIGIATQNFTTNDFGYVTVFGNVRGLNTSSYTLGTVLYYDSVSATDGLLRATVPNAPNAKIEVAAVVRVHATQGILLVRPHVMPKLKDLQDVHAPNPVNGNVLFWNSQLFRNEFGSISNILGYTPANDSQVVKLTGNQSIAGVKTFTSGTTVWNSASTNSLDFQSSGVTVASLIFNSSFTQFNSNASGGYIFKNSSANNSLSISDSGNGVFLGSLTSTSFVKTGGTSSQFLKADGSVDSSTYVPTSRTITINGVTQDLSSNRSFTIAAGVTSVNGLTGSVTLTTSNISEGTNLYYTDARVNANSNVSANTAARHAAVTLGAANGLSLSTQQLSLGLASSSANGALSSTDWTTFNSKQNALSGNGFVRLSGSTVSYITGNPDQYIKADGSLSSAMNSRIEVNFVATAGQTTFTTPYEVGQIDVYYNGSKLYPNEFTATNGTTVVLAQAATLNAQISIVKYVAALSTSAIRNETTFTTTAGQTTFSVNYTVGQLDVFYNGSKLNVSEFTATDGTSVVLGFSCAAGESVVFVSYVNQVSGASGTTNYVSKFTGAASLGNSQIFDNGTNVGIATTTLSEKLNLDGNMLLRSAGAVKFNRSDNAISTDLYDASSYFVLNNRNGNGFAFQSAGSNVVNITSGNLLGIGTGLSGSARLNILNIASAPFLALRSTNNIYEIAKMSFDQSTDILSIVNNQGASSSGITFGTNATERMRINSEGNVGIGIVPQWSLATYRSLEIGLTGLIYARTTSDSGTMTVGSNLYYNSGWKYKVNGGGSLIGQNDGNITFETAPSGTANSAASITERMRITSGGETYIQAGTGYQVRIQPNCQINTTLNGGGASMYLNYQGNGAIYAGSSYAVLYAGSDRRIKTDIKDAESTLEKILNLTPRTFKYKERPNDVSYGFIAQEVEEIMPEIVKTSEGVSNCAGEEIIDQKSIESYGLAWASILVKAMQEQNVIIQELKAEIEILKNK